MNREIKIILNDKEVNVQHLGYTDRMQVTTDNLVGMGAIIAKMLDGMDFNNISRDEYIDMLLGSIRLNVLNHLNNNS